MLGTGQSRHNTHTGDTRIRQGNLFIDGKLQVSGDLEVDGTLVFNGDFTINPPSCLNTDCVNSVSGLGITVSDDLNINSTKNLSTNNINPATPATGIEINNEYKLPIVKGTTNQVLTQVDALGNCEFGDIPNSSTTIPLDWRLIWLGQGRTQYTNNIFQSLVSIQPIGSRPTLNNSNFLRDAILFQESTGRIEVVYDGSNSATWQFKFSYLNDGISVDGFSENLIYTQNVDGYYKFRHYIYNLVVSTGTYPRLYSLVQLEVPDPSDPNKRYLASWINEDVTTNNGQFPDTSGVSPNDTSITQYDLQAQKIVSGTSTTTLYPDGINIWIGANIEVTASGGVGGVVTNPLTQNLVLGGFSIIEPLGAVSPSLNIDQLDITKDIKLKVGGLSKVDVKDNEVSFNENINMNQNQIDNCLVINNQAGQPLNLIGGSNVSAVILDATPTQGVIIGSNVGASTDITGDTSLDLRSNAGNIDLFPSSQMNVIVGGLPRFAVDNTQVNVGNDLNMNNNSILNASGVNTLFLTSTNQIETSLLVGNGVGPLSITSNNLTLTETNIPGGEYMTLDPTENKSFKPLNMNNGPINNVSSINGFTPSGGVFMGTSDGVLITATTAETTLLPLTSVGTLTIPSNGFKISSFHLVVAGNFSSNNGDDLTIRLRSNGTVLGDVIVPLNNSTASNFEIEVDFQIRAIGAAGVADILTNFDFTYNQSAGGGAFVGERNVSQNNLSFDTTISNTLAVSAQFSSASANNSIQSRVVKLSQTY